MEIHSGYGFAEVEGLPPELNATESFQSENVWASEDAENTTFEQRMEQFEGQEKLVKQYSELFDNIDYRLNPNAVAKLKDVLPKILANKAKYLRVSEKTGVPWEMIAAIHYRESSLDFNTYLHNGQRLGRVTTIVPKGKFFTDWEEAAIDALRSENLNLKPDSDLGALAEAAERYNGLGYRYRNLPSPYVWAGTDHYQGGLFVRDGVFDPNKVDRRLGVMPIVSALRELSA